VYKKDLQCCAALSVKGKRTGYTLGYSVIDIGVGQNDGRIFCVKTQNCFQTVRLWVQFLQVVGAFVCSDKGEDIHLTGFHERPHSLTPAAVNNIDDARREIVAESLEQGPDEQYAVLGRLEDNCITH